MKQNILSKNIWRNIVEVEILVSDNNQTPRYQTMACPSFSVTEQWNVDYIDFRTGRLVASHVSTAPDHGKLIISQLQYSME